MLGILGNIIYVVGVLLFIVFATIYQFVGGIIQAIVGLLVISIQLCYRAAWSAWCALGWDQL